MRRFGTYLFIRTLAAFSGVLFTLVGIAWVTQALRRFDLVTAKGQAIALYFGITLLTLPQVLGIVAPFALIVALVIVLHQLQSSSNLVAITAAGVSQRQLVVPFLLVAATVCAFVAIISFWAGPIASRTVSDIGASIRADIVTNVIQPGRFTEIDDGLTFHIRDRAGDGSLVDLFIADQREGEFTYTYTAKRGRIADVLGRSMLVMENGTVERTRRIDRSSTFVVFGSYAFDLSQLTPAANAGRYATNELTISDILAAEHQSDGKYTPVELDSELMNRIAEPFYPLAATLVVFLFLGFPSTNRRGQTSALAAALLFASLTRIVGYGLLGLSKANDAFAPAALLCPPVLILLFGLLVIFGIRPALPRSIGEWLDAVSARLARRFSRASDAEDEAQ